MQQVAFGKRHGTRATGAFMIAALCVVATVACDSEAPPVGPPDPRRILEPFSDERPIAVTLETDHGNIACELDQRRAPRAVSLFVALATGRTRWRHPKTGEVTERPLYRSLTFHRAIPRVMIQSGCVVGDSSGHPGYRIAVEVDPSDRERLSIPGALALARYTPPPYRSDPNPPPPGHVLGSQFAVTLTDMSHLAGQVTVLGRCGNLDTVAAIARAYKRDPVRPMLHRVVVEGAGSHR